MKYIAAPGGERHTWWVYGVSIGELSNMGFLICSRFVR
jgi:hypothetical protein